MEVKKYKKTLTGMFLKYLAIFCVGTVVLIGVVILSFQVLLAHGMILPANYAEKLLQKNAQEILHVDKVEQELIPVGSTYSVYDANGKWLYGNMENQERKDAWEKYLKQNIYEENGGYYRFFTRENGEICIVKYSIRARFAGQSGEGRYINPELLMPVTFILLFLGQAVVVAKIFARQLKTRLYTLHTVTEQIAENTLDFEEAHSDLREIEDVLMSLNHMRDALQTSLKQQWEMEQLREEQIAALAHDIKTPLTVIRGNTELLAEDSESEEVQNCTEVVLKNVSEMENYLEAMQHILRHEEHVKKTETVSCQSFAQELEGKAEQLAKASQMRIAIRRGMIEGNLTLEKSQILRAWENLVSNALEYTKPQQGILMEIECIHKENEEDTGDYLAVKVVDFGNGFSEQDKLHAKEFFYRGDHSRHDRNHQGLGLAIAQKMVKEQGGFLSISNAKETGGAEVTLFLVQ